MTGAGTRPGRTAVVGLGNPFLGDEGIGVRLTQELARRYDCESIDVFDLGTASFRLLHIIAGRGKIVIVDCALMGEPPGTLRRFSFAEAKSTKSLYHHSLHEGDLFDIIALAGADRPAPPEIVIFGIEPAALELRESLSPELALRTDEYLAAVAGECGVTLRDGRDA